MAFDVLATHKEVNASIEDINASIEDTAELVDNKILVFNNVEVTTSATEGTIATITDSRISSDHELLSCEFNDPSNVTSQRLTLTPSDGSATLSGISSGPTSARIILVLGQPQT